MCIYVCTTTEECMHVYTLIYTHRHTQIPEKDLNVLADLKAIFYFKIHLTPL